MAVSELAANAIEHSTPAADGTISVTVMRGAGMARLAVTDGGKGDSTPHLCPMRLDSQSGRGLHMIDKVASSWGFTRGRDSSASWTTTWCEFVFEEVIP